MGCTPSKPAHPVPAALTVYGASWCPHTATLLRLLRAREVPHCVVWCHAGHCPAHVRSYPTTVTPHETIVGAFDAAELARVERTLRTRR